MLILHGLNMRKQLEGSDASLYSSRLSLGSNNFICEILETKEAVQNGADEIDGYQCRCPQIRQSDLVESDIRAVVEARHLLVKVT